MKIEQDDINAKKIDEKMINMLNDHEYKLNNIQSIPGYSAYEIACVHGYTGTEETWLNSLKGLTTAIKINNHVYEQQNGTITIPDYTISTDTNGVTNLQDGLSAYEIAVTHGYAGTEEAWLASLKGATGADGKTAYEIAVANGFTGTEKEWLDSLKGNNGKSNYEIAVINGYTGTETEWLKELAGTDGLSAYELAKRNGYTGTETEWLASLKGDKGDKGDIDTTTDIIYEGIKYTETNGSITLPVSQNLSVKNTENATVTYNGTEALDLTGGLYYAKTAGTANATAKPLNVVLENSTVTFNGSTDATLTLKNATTEADGLMSKTQVNTLNTANANIANLQTTVSNQTIALDTHTSQVTALQDSLSTTQSNLNTTQSNVTILQNDLKTAQSNISNMAGQLADMLTEKQIKDLIMAFGGDIKNRLLSFKKLYITIKPDTETTAFELNKTTGGMLRIWCNDPDENTIIYFEVDNATQITEYDKITTKDVFASPIVSGYSTGNVADRFLDIAFEESIKITLKTTLSNESDCHLNIECYLNRE